MKRGIGFQVHKLLPFFAQNALSRAAVEIGMEIEVTHEAHSII